MKKSSSRVIERNLCKETKKVTEILWSESDHGKLVACVVGGLLGSARASETSAKFREGKPLVFAASPLVFAASPRACTRSPTKPPVTQARQTRRNIKIQDQKLRFLQRTLHCAGSVARRRYSDLKKKKKVKFKLLNFLEFESNLYKT